MRKVKKVAVLTISIALALSLTSCYGAGPNAATRMINRVTDGNEGDVNTDGSNLRVDNLLLVATEDGSAVVIGTIINRSPEDDSLVGISVANVPATITGEINLVQEKPIRFEGDQATSKAVFDAVGAKAGTNVPVELSFARAGVVKFQAIIRDKRDAYAAITK